MKIYKMITFEQSNRTWLADFTCIPTREGCLYLASVLSQGIPKLIEKTRLHLLNIPQRNCCDNAPVESFFHTLKTELIHHREYMTSQEANSGISN